MKAQVVNGLFAASNKPNLPRHACTAQEPLFGWLGTRRVKCIAFKNRFPGFGIDALYSPLVVLTSRWQHQGVVIRTREDNVPAIGLTRLQLTLEELVKTLLKFKKLEHFTAFGTRPFAYHDPLDPAVHLRRTD